ncbi:MAG: site-2 protease family protein, partial [Chloroflexi bacterium]|nr:site-2 protease family protein [Chloroflexota bacterium]
MTALLATVSFLIVVMVLVLAHELGHFITARATGVKVEEFGLGFPPRLLSVKRGETRYSLNAIPLGGFVKLAGEEDPKTPGSLASKTIGTRLLVLSAGALMNFLLPLFLFSIAFMVPHDSLTEPVVIKDVAPNSPAARAGIKAGDTLLSVNGKPLNNNGDLHRYVQLNLGKEITLLARHNDATTESVQVIPRWKPPVGEGATGMELDIEAALSKRTVVSERYPFWKAIPLGVGACIETFILFKNGIVSMIIGTVPVAVTGPVGIAQLTGEVAKSGISPLLEFAAFLSINLAIINIFP